MAILETAIPKEELKPLESKGIIGSQTAEGPMDGTGKMQGDQAQQLKAPTTDPVTTQVGENETVEDRLNTLTAEGSKYTDLAKADAQRSANSRGLINSTMAGAAGVDASIRAALPIAQQDATTATDTRMLNQNTENEFLKNRQSADLNIETAAVQNQLDIQRDTNSASLNEHMAQLESTLQMAEMTLDSELKTAFETTLQDERFSDEAKMNIVDTMNNIVRDTQQQITEVGMSDRSAAQQSAAISMIEANRDAELAVYQDLLESFNDWEWSTDFTPKINDGAADTTTSGSSYVAPSEKPTEPPPPSASFNSYPAYGTQEQGDLQVAKNQSSAGTVSEDGNWTWDGKEWVST